MIEIESILTLEHCVKHMSHIFVIIWTRPYCHSYWTLHFFMSALYCTLCVFNLHVVKVLPLLVCVTHNDVNIAPCIVSFRTMTPELLKLLLSDFHTIHLAKVYTKMIFTFPNWTIVSTLSGCVIGSFRGGGCIQSPCHSHSLWVFVTHPLCFSLKCWKAGSGLGLRLVQMYLQECTHWLYVYLFVSRDLCICDWKGRSEGFRGWSHPTSEAAYSKADWRFCCSRAFPRECQSVHLKKGS